MTLPLGLRHPSPPPPASLQPPFAFRTPLIVPKISGELVNNFEYKLVNLFTLVVIFTFTTVTTVTMDITVIRTAMFIVAIVVTLLFRYVCQWLLRLLQLDRGAGVTHTSQVHDVASNS